jgi:hypothetical protein
LQTGKQRLKRIATACVGHWLGLPQRLGTDQGVPMFGQFFGEFLLQRGAVGRMNLDAAIRLQKERNRPIGLMAMDFGLLTSEQVASVLEEQRATDEQFGQIAIRRGLLDYKSLAMLLSHQAGDHLFIGQALVEKGCLRLEELEFLLDEFRRHAALEAGRIRRVVESLPRGEVLVACVAPVLRCLSRTLSGAVRVDDALVEWNGFEPARTISVSLSFGRGGRLALGLLLSRTALPRFVYCLLQKETRSERIIGESLSGFGSALAYAVAAELTRAGEPASAEDVLVEGNGLPDSEAVVLQLASGIGPLFLSLWSQGQGNGRADHHQ